MNDNLKTHFSIDFDECVFNSSVASILFSLEGQPEQTDCTLPIILKLINLDIA